MTAAPRIVIAAGGTAGHVVPAIAVAGALRADGAEVHFIGGSRAEAELVPQAGFPLHTIAVGGLSRSHPLRAARSLALAARALPRARRLLSGIGPDAVLGAGGYVAGPVGLAAVAMRLPLVLTEADSHLGLTNRALAPMARRVCLSFPLAGRVSSRYVLTGRPIPPARADRAQARRQLGLEPQELCVLVFGGSLGARSINLAAIDGLAEGSFRVLHVCGRRDHAELAGTEPRAGYELREYMDLDAFAQALAAADLAVARAGGSVFELAAYGLPAILVPYPHASGDHQSANARWMADAGAAVVMADEQLTPARLRTQVQELLGDRDRLASMSAAARSLARPDAAERVARELLQAAGR